MSLPGMMDDPRQVSDVPMAALTGIRVLDLADEKGAYCGKLLADMGADVIKVERPGGDPIRWNPPFWGGAPHPERGILFLYTNLNKRGITLDFTTDNGKAIFRRLAARADVVLETFRPGYLDRLGIGYDQLKVTNTGLIWTSITDFGQNGPWRDYKSNDLVANALGGSMYVVGEEDDPPVRLAGNQAYVMSSLYAATSTMIAYFHRLMVGKGQRIDISLEEAVASATHTCGPSKWLDDKLIVRRRGPSLFASAPSGAYPCRDGSIYLMVNRPLHWKALAAWINEVTGNEEVINPMFEGPSSARIPYHELLDVFISELTSRFTVAEVYEEGQRRHIAITPFSNARDVANDAHLAARDFFVEVACRHGNLRYPSTPFRHSETPARVYRPAPRAGEHNRDILGGELGFSDEQLAALAAAGVT